ncbi:hypothetical protein F4779DRAFT_618464 [Xylariaceae sp. FL0662B]|nr:hypothetical protein F4779DRAFT_618464 [Xylariaceae sp. FL0662B]
MDFVYIQGKPECLQERQAVAAGWRWVRTNTIGPTHLDKPIDFANPDRLLPHSHHSINIHLIVVGDLCIESYQNGRRNRFEISSISTADQECVIQPNVVYKGTSRHGCSFIEGHRSLSPRTAERFIDRGTLRAVELRRGSCRLPETTTLKRWLREAEFRPGGKAEPDPTRGEWLILTYADEAVSEADRRARKEIAKWFEKEWRQPKSWSWGLIGLYLIVGLSAIIVAVFYPNATISDLFGIFGEIFHRRNNP